MCLRWIVSTIRKLWDQTNSYWIQIHKMIFIKRIMNNLWMHLWDRKILLFWQKINFNRWASMINFTIKESIGDNWLPKIMSNLLKEIRMIIKSFKVLISTVSFKIMLKRWCSDNRIIMPLNNFLRICRATIKHLHRPDLA